MLRQVHGNLPRIHNRARIVLSFDLDQAQAKLLGHHFLDGLDGYLARLRIDEVFQHLLSVRQRNLRPNQRRVRYQSDESAFEFPHIRPDV